jgi:hypothetical protein
MRKDNKDKSFAFRVWMAKIKNVHYCNDNEMSRAVDRLCDSSSDKKATTETLRILKKYN